MDRSARLQSAPAWVRTYEGKNIAAGYRKHFAVDWACAFRELEMLGVKIDSAYKDQILKLVAGRIAAGRRRSPKSEVDKCALDQDETFAYIAGYTEAGFAFGVTWEELDERPMLDRATDPD